MKASISSPNASRTPAWSSQESASEFKQNLALNLKHIWYHVVTAIVGSADPKIWKLTNSEGAAYWRVYDPANRQSYVFDTEHEVRVWIEQRYNQVG
jgi:hypothetical protein